MQRTGRRFDVSQVLGLNNAPASSIPAMVLKGDVNPALYRHMSNLKAKIESRISFVSIAWLYMSV